MRAGERGTDEPSRDAAREAIIEVSARDSPLEPVVLAADRRVLDREAEEYIVGCARDLPRRMPITLVLRLHRPGAAGDERQSPADAIREHFARRAEMSRRALRHLLRRGRTSLIIATALLAASLVASDFVARSMGDSPLTTVLRESLVIGGWVAMWRPMELFLYDCWDVVNERRVLERLRDAHIRIVCDSIEAVAVARDGHAG